MLADDFSTSPKQTCTCESKRGVCPPTVLKVCLPSANGCHEESSRGKKREGFYVLTKISRACRQILQTGSVIIKHTSCTISSTHLTYLSITHHLCRLQHASLYSRVRHAAVLGVVLPYDVEAVYSSISNGVVRVGVVPEQISFVVRASRRPPLIGLPLLPIHTNTKTRFDLMYDTYFHT